MYHRTLSATDARRLHGFLMVGEDGRQIYEEAAAHTDDPGLQKLLTDQASTRSKTINALKPRYELHSGEQLHHPRSVQGLLQQWCIELGQRFGSEHAALSVLFSQLEKLEDHTLNMLYKTIRQIESGLLAKELSEQIVLVLESHHRLKQLKATYRL